MPSSPLRILLVEDNEEDAQAFNRAFEKSHLSHDITRVADAGTALARLVEDPGPFDLAVINHRQSGKSGLDLIHQLFERKISLPKVILTDNEGLAVQLQKMKFIDEFLIKDRRGEYLTVLPLLIAEVAWQHAERIAREREKKAIQALETRYRTVLANIADGVLILDKRGRVKLLNPAARRLFQGSANRLLGKQAFVPIQAGRSEIVIENTPSGETATVEMEVTEMEWKEEMVWLASVRDITYRKRMEESLKATNQQLVQTIDELRRANKKMVDQQKAVIEEERLKVLLQMAGATAHELNQPLMILLGSIDLLQMHEKNPEKHAQFIEKIEEAGKRISRIVKQIQTIRHDETVPYVDGSRIINLNQHPLDRDLHILVADPSEADFRRVKEILKAHSQIRLRRAESLSATLTAAQKAPVDLILAEHRLPDGTAVDLLERLQKEEIPVPLVVLTGYGDERIASQVIQAGAFEYIPKSRMEEEPFIQIILASMEKARLKQEIQEAQKKMARMSVMDALTGLYNRRYLNWVLKQEFARARRAMTDLVLGMLDIDLFKQLNDRYGHSAGDAVLSEMGRMLRGWTRQSDVVCRYGGEEFVILLPNTNLKNAETMSQRFREAVAAHAFVHGEDRFRVTVSIGITGFRESAPKSPRQMVDQADQALYQAKRRGRNRVAAYVPAPRTAAT